MKQTVLTAVLVFTLLLLVGMGKQPDNPCQDCYKTGYQDAIKSVEKSSREFRNDLKSGLETQLLWYSIIIVSVTLWGSELGEWFRARIKNWFNLTTETQVVIALMVYGLIVFGILIGCLNTSGISEKMLIPVLILLAASLIPFIRYLRNLSGNNAGELKMNLTKLKQILIFCVVILILFQVLSDSGFLGIKIGG